MLVNIILLNLSENNVLRQTDKEISDIDKQIKKEIDDGIISVPTDLVVMTLLEKSNRRINYVGKN